jgi:hypothetical protein
MELNKTPALAQFNKINGLFTMVLGKVSDVSKLNHEFYFYREIEIDIHNEIVVGNIDNFQIVSIHSQPLEIRENSLNLYAREKIIEEYPLERQLTILGLTLEKLVDAAGIEAEDLKDMNEFIAEVKRINGVKKEFFAQSPDYRYISTDDQEQIIQEKYQGAISEYGESIVSL